MMLLSFLEMFFLINGRLLFHLPTMSLLLSVTSAEQRPCLKWQREDQVYSFQKEIQTLQSGFPISPDKTRHWSLIFLQVNFLNGQISQLVVFCSFLAWVVSQKGLTPSASLHYSSSSCLGPAVLSQSWVGLFVHLLHTDMSDSCLF